MCKVFFKPGASYRSADKVIATFASKLVAQELCIRKNDSLPPAAGNFGMRYYVKAV